MKKKRKKIVILGGGLAGLAAADLLTRDHDVVILEKQSFLGGLAASFKHDDYMVPMYYHHVIKSNTITQAFLNRYNLLKDAVWKKINIVIGVNKKTSNITKPLGLLGFDFLNLWGKFRFGLFGLYTIFAMNPDKIPDDMNAEDWLNSWAGKQVTSKVFTNLYARNKFDVPLSVISAKQFAWRLAEKEVYDDFTYPPKGLQCMVDNLEKDIKKKGGIILKSVDITKVDFKKKEVHMKKHPTQKADAIITTIPLPVLVDISTGMPSEYKKQLSKIKFTPAVGLVFGTDKFLDKNVYWTNFFQERIHVAIQHSVLIDKYPDKLNWCIRYGGSAVDLPLSDKEIKKEYLGVIKKYYPHVDIKWSVVFREKYAEPVYDKDYTSYKPDHRTPMDGVYMAGIQVTHPKIRNMNTALESGIKVAKFLQEDIDDDKF